MTKIKDFVRQDDRLGERLALLGLTLEYVVTKEGIKTRIVELKNGKRK